MSDTMTFESEVHSFQSMDSSYEAGSMISISIISMKMQIKLQNKKADNYPFTTIRSKKWDGM